MNSAQAKRQTKQRKLTRKEEGFVNDYVATGNGTQSALKNYDTDDYKTASVIASENLDKPRIQRAIAERLPDDFLEQKHKELFSLKRIDYFVFPKNMEDEEIIQHVSAQGLTVITVRESDKGKMAFYSIPDGQAMSKALDMAYKIKGAYGDENKPPAPNSTYNFFFNPEIQREVSEIENRIKNVLKVKPKHVDNQ